MKKIKEKIIEIQNFEICAERNVSALDEVLDILDQELQDYTFIRVPKRVKLSEMIERLKQVFKNTYYNKKYPFEISDGRHWLIDFENKINSISNSFWEFKFKEIRNNDYINFPEEQEKIYKLYEYLYVLKNAETFIEVDV